MRGGGGAAGTGTGTGTTAGAPPRDTLALTPHRGNVTPQQPQRQGQGQGQGQQHQHQPTTTGVAGDLAAMLRSFAAEQLAETKRAMHAEVRNVHVEVLKQFHEMREEQLAMFEEIRGAQRELSRELEALRRTQQEYVRR